MSSTTRSAAIAFLITAIGACRSGSPTEAAPTGQTPDQPAVQLPSAAEEPATIATPAYRLVMVPVSNTEFHGKPYAPAFLLDHYAFTDPGRQLVTVVQFIWQRSSAGGSLGDGEEMAALRSSKVVVELIDHCGRPAVTFRVKVGDGCPDDYWLPERQQRCIAGAAIVCCYEELPMWTMPVSRGRGLPF